MPVDCSRRDFLKKAATSAAALALSPGELLPAPLQSQNINYPTWESLIDKRDFSLKVSDSILKLFKREFDPHEEDGFVLLANMQTGVIDKACGLHTVKRASDYKIEPGYMKYLDGFARAHIPPYFVVGTYHSHPHPRGGFYAGDLLSDGDHGPIDPFDSPVQLDTIRLLGHGSVRLAFKTRAFVRLNPYILGKDHPFMAYVGAPPIPSAVARSAYDGSVDKKAIELKIVPVPSDTAFGAEDILRGRPFMTYTTVPLSRSAFERLHRGLKGADDTFPCQDSDVKCRLKLDLRHDGFMRVSFLAEKTGSSKDTLQQMREYVLELKPKQHYVNANIVGSYNTSDSILDQKSITRNDISEESLERIQAMMQGAPTEAIRAFRQAML